MRLEYIINLGKTLVPLTIEKVVNEKIYVVWADRRDVGALYYNTNEKKWIGTEPFAIFVAEELGAFIELSKKFQHQK